MGIEMTDLEDTKNNAGVADKPQFSGEWVRLGDVATYVNGYAFKPTDYASEGKPIIRIQDLTGNAYQTNRFAGVLDDKYRVGWGDVLISWSASLGVYEWGSEEAWLNQHIFKVQFNKLPVNKRFFIHQARYVIAESTSLAHGATMRHLTKKVFDNLPFFYPSEHDQDEIACRLDGVQLQIDSAREVIARLDDLVKSRFNEMFGDPVYGKRWPSVTLAELCTKLGSGATPLGGKSAYKTEGVPFVRSMNVRNGRFEWKDLAYIDGDQAVKLKGVTLKKGDVLLNITGASVARSCLLPDELAGGRVNQHVSIVRTNQDKMLPIVLNAVLISDSYQSFLLSGSKMAGSTREALTKGDLEKMTTPLPPLDLQNQFAAFVRKVDKLRFMLLANPSPAFGCRSICCSTNSGNGGVILDA